MIDLQGPVAPEYSEEEKETIRRNFLILLHSFLILYLSLHNLIIPLILNGLRGNDFLQDVHYWFLFHLPVHYWLRKNKPIRSSYNLFLLLGSISRLVFYSFFMFTKSWTIVSVFLSEISSIIFCIVIWNMMIKDRTIFLAFIGLLIPPYLASIEKYPPDALPQKISRARSEVDYHALGCRGSELLLNSEKLPHLSGKSLGQVKNCGFETNLLSFEKNFTLVNHSSHDHNLRLYKIKKKNDRVSWKFMKMIRLKKDESVDLTSDLKTKSMYLLKSPERRQVGMLVLVPRGTEITGEFSLTFDSIKWRKK